MTPEELFEKYERLAYWYLHRFLPTRVNDEDYHQISLLGLWKACQSYSEDKKSSFTTYAVACISREFSKYHSYIHREKREGNFHLYSIDKSILGDGEDQNESSVSEVIGDPDSLRGYDSVLDREFLEYVYDNRHTTKNQKKLISLICRGYEPNEIFKEMGITRQRVHQMKRQLKDRYGEEYHG